jgi:hypothetical protein
MVVTFVGLGAFYGHYISDVLNNAD